LEWKLSKGVLEELKEVICPKCGSKEISSIIQEKPNSEDNYYLECDDCNYQWRKVN